MLYAYFYHREVNHVKGGPGTGMFEFPKSETITIGYKEEKFEVDGDNKQKIIDMFLNKNWRNIKVSNKSYKATPDDIYINFNTGRAELYINFKNYEVYLNGQLQSSAEDAYTYIVDAYNADSLEN